jgi:hypothetical protein
VRPFGDDANFFCTSAKGSVFKSSFAAGFGPGSAWGSLRLVGIGFHGECSLCQLSEGRTSANVCCAIISSSSVGMTHTETRLSAVEMRGPLESFACPSSFTPSHASLAHSGRADLGGVLTNAGGEHESVQPAEHGRVGAGIFGHRVDEVLHRGDRARIRTLLQHSHVIADAG